MDAQCKVKKLNKTTDGYAGVMTCFIEGGIKETRSLIYQRNLPPSLSVHGQVLYKCRSTPLDRGLMK